ncbi:MAG: hypothetical protein CMJ20_02420 [Phycisphaeraceae bacterium]|jgi:hypothetical protein|nr:hypothetical protein [Phycisphaeraceae bacterium]|tara:strand:+ start:1304 stop:1534 length:231 start_codon:yes stop_codon:yes gene_type:complete
MTNANNTSTLKIGRTTYAIEKSETREHASGLVQRWTNLRGSRGAKKVLVESASGARLIHMGSARSEILQSGAIKRG